MDALSMLSPAMSVITHFGVQVSSRGAPTNAAACPEACAGRVARGDLAAGLCPSPALRAGARDTPTAPAPEGLGALTAPGHCLAAGRAVNPEPRSLALPVVTAGGKR